MNTAEIANQLSGFCLFTKLPANEIELLVNGTKLLDIARDAILINRCERVHGFYLLIMSLKPLTGICSWLALAGSIGWLAHAPDWNPMTALFGTTTACLSADYTSYKNQLKNGLFLETSQKLTF